MINRLDTHHDVFPVWNFMADAQGGLAFDVGANIGQSTKVLARRFDHVVAFEPNPESFLILQDEMPPNVAAKNVAISDVNGDISLDVASYSITTGQYVTGPGLHWGELTDKVDVPARTLDNCAERFGFPEFVKVDTEGHEVEVIRGGPMVFYHHPQVVIEIHKVENEEKVKALLPDYEFTKVTHPARVRESEIRANHFWLLGGAECRA